MNDLKLTGHDGPYDAPISVDGGAVRPDWIDYNGHMNVAYYTTAFDIAIDVLLEDHLGIGETYVADSGCGPFALQSHYSYAAELVEGEQFYTSLRLLDHDAKRIHLFCQIHKKAGNELAASVETLIMNVDHSLRKAAPYPPRVEQRLADMLRSHRSIDHAPQIGAPIGIRRK